MQSINPKNGRIIAEYEAFSDSEIESGLALAQDAFLRQRGQSMGVRARNMLCVADILEAECDKFAQIATDEMGKTLVSAVAEVRKCASLCQYYAQNAEMFLADEVVPTQAERSFVRYLPLGVILGVMPWNFPFWQVFRFAVPAIMAGNAVVLKHASNVPGCALAIEEIFRKGGFEAGIFQSFLIGADKVGALIADPRIKAVSLTGSEGAGRAVAALAGQHIKKCVLELGGSDPFIVMPSADLSKAVDLAVRGRVQNNGQTCIAAKRYIVHEAIYDGFRDALVQKYESLRIGDPLDPDTDVGPLATPSIRRELETQVRQSVEAGAVCLTGAYVMEGDGNFYRPGLLEKVPVHAPAYGEELFGAVGTLFYISSMAEAITLANDTRFGLGSAVMTQDKAEMEMAINGIEAGCTFINALVTSDPRLPFGGVKASGYGRELAKEGIREFCNIKTINIA